MKEYDFTLNFSLTDAKLGAEQVLERLGKKGCTDALVGIGQAGRVALHFTRVAPSAFEAVRSALSDVKRALPPAELVEASPDFVGLTDVAELIGFTRQNMRKLFLRHGAAFPTPVHGGNPAIWHLAKVLRWLTDRERYRVDERLLEVAEAAMQLNIAKEARELRRPMRREIRELVA